MPEFRKDPTSDRWVIIATERAKRPIHPEASDTALCPFCAGNETMTPPEVMVFRDQGDAFSLSHWTVRVVPNKYPALVPDSGGFDTTDRSNEVPSGVGVHEVIIESPYHVTDVTLLGESQFETVLRAYRTRIMDLRGDKRFRYILIYKNQGTEAGATLEHAHSQLIAMPMIPKLILDEINSAKNYYQTNRRCVFCDVILQKTVSERFVTENARYLVICPFAARFPYETWILPKRHTSLFERNTQQDDVDLAGILRDTLIRLKRSLDGGAFNYFIHSNPLVYVGNA